MSERVGIPSDEAAALMTNLKPFLTVAENATIFTAQRPLFRNYQMTLETTGESEDTRSLAEGIGEISQHHNIRVKSFRVYGAVEQEVWKRVRSRHLGGAEQAVATCKPERKDRLKLDWAAGASRLLSTPDDSTGELLGNWRRARERWALTAGLTRVGLDVARLEEQRALQADS